MSTFDDMDRFEEYEAKNEFRTPRFGPGSEPEHQPSGAAGSESESSSESSSESESTSGSESASASGSEASAQASIPKGEDTWRGADGSGITILLMFILHVCLESLEVMAEMTRACLNR